MNPMAGDGTTPRAPILLDRFSFVLDIKDLHLDAIRAEKDSDHFWASSGGGLADKDDSVLRRRKKPKRSLISDLNKCF